MKINDYNFGHITVNGKEYTSDLIIYPEKIDASWWRKEGHNICMEDIKDIIEKKPEIIIFGKGSPGLMKIPKDIQSKLKDSGFEIYVSNTKSAVKKYNDISDKKNTVAALHLTC